MTDVFRFDPLTLPPECESLRREVRNLTAPRTLKPIEPVVPPRVATPRTRRAQNGSPSADKKPASISQ